MVLVCLWQDFVILMVSFLRMIAKVLGMKLHNFVDSFYNIRLVKERLFCYLRAKLIRWFSQIRKMPFNYIQINSLSVLFPSTARYRPSSIPYLCWCPTVDIDMNVPYSFTWTLDHVDGVEGFYQFITYDN